MFKKVVLFGLFTGTAYAGDNYIVSSYNKKKLSGIWNDNNIAQNYTATKTQENKIGWFGSLDNKVTYDVNFVFGKENANKNQNKNRYSRLDIKELYLDHDLSDNSNFRIGKYSENWQVGLGFAPMSIMTPYNKKISISNAKRQGSGIYGITYNYLTDDGEINVYYGIDREKQNKDPVNVKGYNHMALRYAKSLNENTDISLIVHKMNVGNVGYGGSYRQIVNDNMSVYTSTLIRKGTVRGVHKGVLNNNVNYVANSDPVSSYRTNDGKTYHHSVIGMQYTTDNNYMFITEFSYDKSGMNNAQWNTYKQMVNNHAKITGAQTPLKNPNLMWDSKLLNQNGLRQKYLLVRGEKTFNEKHNITLMSTFSMDKSAMWQAKYKYLGFEDAVFGVNIMTVSGGKDTEYGGYFPYKDSIEFYISRDF
ncbi:MAG: hypothetical protein ACPG8V_04590 [Alphaproteobacteria bacterium]